MFLCAAHAMAISKDKEIAINGILKGSPKDPVIAAYVDKFALVRCLLDTETDDVIAVTLYEDEEE